MRNEDSERYERVTIFPRCECGYRAPSEAWLETHRQHTGCPVPQARPLLYQRAHSSTTPPWAQERGAA